MKRLILLSTIALSGQVHAAGYLAPFITTGDDSCDAGCNLNYDVDHPALGLMLGVQGGGAFVYGAEAQLSNKEIGGNAFVGLRSGGFQFLAGANMTMLDADLDLGPGFTSGSDTESSVGPFADLSYSGFFVRWARHDVDFDFTTTEITGTDVDGNPIYGADRSDSVEAQVDRYSVGYRITF